MKKLWFALLVVLSLVACKPPQPAAGPSDAAAKLAAVQGPGLVLVDFFTTWCGPCKAMKPVVEQVEKEFAGKLQVVTVDCDQYGSIAEQYGVEGYPTFVILKDGKVLEKKLGGMEASRFKAWVGGYVEASR